MRVLVVADMHLSAARSYAQPAWESILDYVSDSVPDLVVSLGDAVLDAPDDAKDRRFARSQLNRLVRPWVAIPGGHDVGDCPPDPWQGEYVTAERVAAYLKEYGTDRFVVECAGWRLVGVNAQTLGSELSRAEDDWHFLQTTLAGAQGRCIVFLHKPPCLERLDEVQESNQTLPANARRRLTGLLRPARVPLVISGHLHRYRRSRDGSISFAWAPTTGLISREEYESSEPGLRNGVLLLTLKPGHWTTALVEPPGIAALDYGSLPDGVPRGSRFLPPLPLARTSQFLDLDDG